MLRRHGVSGGRGRILEHYCPGLGQLSAMDRHVMANSRLRFLAKGFA
jgi:aconitate hydratase